MALAREMERQGGLRELTHQEELHIVNDMMKKMIL